MYRPEDWNNPYHLRNTATSLVELYNKYPEFEIYEAGADAMLEKLKDKGVFTYGHHTPDIDLSDAPEVSGYWVFIPDEV